MFFAARLGLGAVDAVMGPATPSLTGDLVPARQRARALGFIESGQLFGAGVGFVLAAVVTAFLSYRWCFWILGIASVLLAVALSSPRYRCSSRSAPMRCWSRCRSSSSGPSSSRARGRPWTLCAST